MDTSHRPDAPIQVAVIKKRSLTLVFFVTVVAFFLVYPQPSQAQWCFSPTWSCGTLSNWGLSFYTGYLGSAGGADISFTAHNMQMAGSLNSIRQKFSLQGINLDLVAPIRLYGPYGLAVGIGYAPCFQGPADETLQFESANSISRTWLAQPQIFNLQIALSMDVGPSLTGVFGLKYENFVTNFVNAESITNGYYGGRNSVDFTFSAYVPHVGFVYGSSFQNSDRNFRVGVTGFPLLLGSVNYRESVVGGVNIGGKDGMPGFQGSDTVTSGYYINAFADTAITVANSVRLAVYGKYDLMSATANDVITGADNANIPNVRFDFNFKRSYWGVGIRASIGF